MAELSHGSGHGPERTSFSGRLAKRMFGRRMTPLARRRRGMAGVLAVALVAAGLGWWASSRVQSQQQAAAATRPPKPSVITAPVEFRVLRSTVVARGTVVSTRTVQVGPNTAPAGTTAAIATAIPHAAGTHVGPGTVVLEVSGRPVFLLPGDLPAYRDLGPGMSGPDVTQLQEALSQAGYPVTADGTYGAATASAVARLYNEHHYAPTTSAMASHAKGAQPAPALATFPAAEVAFAPAREVTIQAVNIARGDVVVPNAVVLAAGTIRIDVALRPQDAGLIRPGTPAQIYSEVLNQRLAGSVETMTTHPPGLAPDPGSAGSVGTATGQTSGASGAAAGTRYAVISPGSSAQDLVGQDVRVSLFSAHSAGKVLAVPVSAVVSTSSGNTSLIVDSAGTERTVPISTGIVADGYVQVTEVGGAAIKPGDQVVVGSAGRTGSAGGHADTP